MRIRLGFREEWDRHSELTKYPGHEFRGPIAAKNRPGRQLIKRNMRKTCEQEAENDHSGLFFRCLVQNAGKSLSLPTTPFFSPINLFSSKSGSSIDTENKFIVTTVERWGGGK